MKKPVSILFLFLLASVTALAQMAEDKKAPALKTKTHLVFLLEDDQFFYTSNKEKKKIKLAAVDSATIHKIVDEELARTNVSKKDFNVAIDGDEVMSNRNFQVLLETLLAKKINRVKIVTSLFE